MNKKQMKHNVSTHAGFVLEYNTMFSATLNKWKGALKVKCM